MNTKTDTPRMRHGNLTIMVIELNDEKAKEFLDNTPDFQRDIRSFQIEKYARILRSGDWKFLGDPIRISATGKLCDGQHRVSAMLKTGIYPPILLISGFPDDVETYAGIDTGKGRSNTDWFKAYGVKNSSVVCSTSILLWRVMNGRAGKMHVAVAPFNEVYKLYKANKELIEDSIKKTRHTKTMMGSFGAICAVHVLIANDSGTAIADKFIDQLASAIGHKAVIAIRKRLNQDNGRTRKRIGSTERFILVLNAAKLMANDDSRGLVRGCSPIPKFETLNNEA